MPFIPSAALASGVQRQSETQTVTTDPDTFTAEPTFDCALPTVVAVTLMATVFTPDGETFGDQPGEIMGIPDTTLQSADGISWSPSTSLITAEGSHTSNGAFIAPGQYNIYMYAASRYLRLVLSIVDSDYAPYAGPNHPTITFAVSGLWL